MSTRENAGGPRSIFPILCNMLEAKRYVSSQTKEEGERERGYQVRYIIDRKVAAQLVRCRPPSSFYIPPNSHDSEAGLAKKYATVSLMLPSHYRVITCITTAHHATARLA